MRKSSKAAQSQIDPLSYLWTQHQRMTGIMDNLIGAIEKKAEDAEAATSLKDLTAIFGVLVDKLVKVKEMEQDVETDGSVQIIDDL